MEKPYMTDEEKLQEYERKKCKRNRNSVILFIGIVLMSIAWVILYFIK